MIRVLRLSRKLPGCRQFLHTLKSRELDEPAYHKKPLDPQILSLVKKYDSDILYSSHIELNKKPLTYKQRTELLFKIGSSEYLDELKKASESEPSLLIEKLVEFDESKQNIDKSKSTVLVHEEKPSPPVTKELTPEDVERNAQLAKDRLKILTEMGLRRSAIEHEIKSYPDNWMEDYETFDENDYLADTEYGTPGKVIETATHALIFKLYFFYSSRLRSKNTNHKGTLSWMWFKFTLYRSEHSGLFAK